MMAHGGAVLVVDDDAAVCRSIREGLTGEGYACDVASSANEALHRLTRRRFDVALLEIALPDTSGIELLKAARASLERTAIIMLSALREIDAAVESMKLGAVDYIVKPFAMEKLIASVGEALQKERIGRPEGQAIARASRQLGKDMQDPWVERLDAIAWGVDAQVDYFDFHWQNVTEKTMELGQRFGIPKKDIAKWRRARDQVLSERNHRVQSALSKLEGNLAVPVLMGPIRSLSGFSENTTERHK